MSQPLQRPQASAAPAASSRAPDARPVLRPGDTCWLLARAERAAALIDGAVYFSRLNEALHSARRSIMILGWDFDSRIKLHPEDPEAPALGDLLRSLVEERPELEVRVLIWSIAVMHAPSEPMQLLFGGEWDKHPRITLKLDRFHPIYAAHHQKIVTVDDSIAFSGGMDLTVRRWDTHPHEIDNPARLSPEGAPYAPIHDAQMAVDGEAAARLAELARERWRLATGEALPACQARRNIWPRTLEPDFTNHAIGIARTSPLCGDRDQVSEVERLTRASLEAAQRCIYIEQQYMTSTYVGDILARQLERPDGPEIVVLMTQESRGLVERLVMGNNRDRLIRRLRRHDAQGRLRICYPVIRAPAGAVQIMMHSKLMIVDDWFLRIGSANLNNRSMGLDTECDLALEARIDMHDIPLLLGHGAVPP
jgi:phosphatidylserine/phosphatidylglycerophosphate/cardiolipin synthase-like enzyme